MRLTLLLAVVMPIAIHADDTFTSGEGQVALVELFTSEGCSSCPPADRWLSGLRDDPGLWKDFVPVGWHVDYWDGLGWPDRFASGKFTARQRSYAREWRDSSVYTPAMVLGGQAWSGWRGGAHPKLEKAAVGNLVAKVAEDGTVTATFEPVGDAKGPWIVHVALLGSGLRSDVKAGENRGRELRHDFTALDYASAEMVGSAATISLQAPVKAAQGKRALAVWITRAGGMRPIQATGGWLSD